jgi:hypothetical protein
MFLCIFSYSCNIRPVKSTTYSYISNLTNITAVMNGTNLNLNWNWFTLINDTMQIVQEGYDLIGFDINVTVTRPSPLSNGTSSLLVRAIPITSYSTNTMPSFLVVDLSNQINALKDGVFDLNVTAIFCISHYDSVRVVWVSDTYTISVTWQNTEYIVFFSLIAILIGGGSIGILFLSRYIYQSYQEEKDRKRRCSYKWKENDPECEKYKIK